MAYETHSLSASNPVACPRCGGTEFRFSVTSEAILTRDTCECWAFESAAATCRTCLAELDEDSVRGIRAWLQGYLPREKLEAFRHRPYRERNYLNHVDGF